MNTTYRVDSVTLLQRRAAVKRSDREKTSENMFMSSRSELNRVSNPTFVKVCDFAWTQQRWLEEVGAALTWSGGMGFNRRAGNTGSHRRRTEREGEREAGRERGSLFLSLRALGKKGRKPERGRAARTNRGEMDGGGGTGARPLLIGRLQLSGTQRKSGGSWTHSVLESRSTDPRTHRAGARDSSGPDRTGPDRSVTTPAV
ncbi:hypothetical protein INR49_008151 [Caranx melampygus]|nr:hypothetical protein INR49_008151 [Caranx melampygus]